MKPGIWSLLGVAAVAAITVRIAWPEPSAAQPPAAAPIDAEVIFGQRCKACHEPAVDRAPTREAMRLMRPPELVEILSRGAMAPMASGLSPAEISALAAHLGAQTPQQQAAGRGGGRGGPPIWNPTLTDTMCATHPPIRKTATDFASFGYDAVNSRFQRNPGLKTADLPRLKVKWAYAVRAGSYGAPIVVGDHLFQATRGGGVIALDAKTGCVHWKNDDLQSRTSSMAEYRPGLSPSGWVSFIGSRDRTVSAIDLQTGKVVWKSAPLDTHPASGITGSPIVYGDRIFVPLTSGEEGSGGADNYACCSFRGSLAALDIKTGAKLWQTSMVPEPMRPTRKNRAGTQLQGPAGAAIWSAPTIDAKRGQVIVTTGDSYTEADTKGADAIVAMDMATGAIRWMSQVTEDDNFIVGCNRPTVPSNCPAPPGPDYDFGASPIIKTVRGKDVVLAGQKSGEVYGLDPVSGKVLWKERVGAGSSLGGVEWGIAADDRYVYAPVSDAGGLMEIANRKAGRPALSDQFFQQPKPGVTALDPLTGKIAWHTPTPQSPCTFIGDRSRERAQGCFPASSAAPVVIPGALIEGSVDGWLRAYDVNNGKVLWAFSTTAQRYATTNGVKDQPGGGINSVGPTVAGGMVYVMSGYNGAVGVGGNGTNVLLAFSVDGK